MLFQLRISQSNLLHFLMKCGVEVGDNQCKARRSTMIVGGTVGTSMGAYEAAVTCKAILRLNPMWEVPSI